MSLMLSLMSQAYAIAKYTARQTVMSKTKEPAARAAYRSKGVSDVSGGGANGMGGGITTMSGGGIGGAGGAGGLIGGGDGAAP